MPTISRAPCPPPACAFAIVASRFNALVVEPLIAGAVDAIVRSGGNADAITIVRCPGAWELPQVVRRVIARGNVDAVVALGAVIRGSTPHFDYVAGEAARGLARAPPNRPRSRSASACSTTDTIEQALERAGAKAGNKGFDAAMAAIELATLFRALAAPGRNENERGQRRSGRAYALQLLYARDNDAAADVAGVAARWAAAFELELEPDAQAFAARVWSARPPSTRARDRRADRRRRRRTGGIERMTRVDRNILRLGASELVAFARRAGEGRHQRGGRAREAVRHSRVVGVRQRRARSRRGRGRPVAGSLRTAVALSVLPLDLARWDETARDCLVLPVFKDDRPLRGAAGLADWRLCGRLSRLVKASKRDRRRRRDDAAAAGAPPALPARSVVRARRRARATPTSGFAATSRGSSAWSTRARRRRLVAPAAGPRLGSDRRAPRRRDHPRGQLLADQPITLLEDPAGQKDIAELLRSQR